MDIQSEKKKEVPFFTLKAEEKTHPLALLCVSMTETMMNDPETATTAKLEGKFLDGFNHLKAKLLSMESKDKQVERADIDLDVVMSFAMIHSIVQPFYRMKGHLLLKPEQRKPISDEIQEEIEQVYETLKDQAADLLQRLTTAWGYTDYGLQTLEEVFEIKTAVRPLKVDNETEITSILINDQNSLYYKMVFNLFNVLEHYQDKYDFAKRFFSCQFIHIDDYKEVKKKLHATEAGEEVSLTLRNCVAIYLILSAIGKLFVSDAAELYDELSKGVDQDSTRKTNSRDVRNYFLKFTDTSLQAIRETMKKEKIHYHQFMQEIERLNIPG